jgi:cysteine desulfuration protein SufE
MARTIDDLVDDFELFEDWEERYRYIVDLGKNLVPMDEADKTEANKVRGCMSQVWMTCRNDNGSPPVLTFTADSDAFIVKGLIAILMELYSGRTPPEILELDADRGAIQAGPREPSVAEPAERLRGHGRPHQGRGPGPRLTPRRQGDADGHRD